MTSTGTSSNLIVGVDPGRDIGVAEIWDHDTFNWWESRDPIVVVGRILGLRPRVVALEMYAGSGPVGKDGAFTIRVEGYLYYTLCNAGIVVVRRTSQARLHQIEEAEKHLPLHAQRHMKDALAHALGLRGKEFG